MNKSQSMGMYIILGIMVLAFISMIVAGPNTSTSELSYTEFLNKVSAGDIKSVEIEKDGNMLIAQPKAQIPVQKKNGDALSLLYGEQKAPTLQYKVMLPNDSTLMSKLEAANVNVTVRKASEGSQWLNILGSLVLPLIFIIFLIIMAKGL